MSEMIERRALLRSGLGFIACAPAIVRASSLMPVRTLLRYDAESFEWLSRRMNEELCRLLDVDMSKVVAQYTISLTPHTLLGSWALVR